MATYTNHYEMTKQQSPERVSVGLLNDNFDIIDGVMFANQEKSEQLADDYNASETYNTGDYVRRENYLYKCNTDNTTGTWDDTKWDRVKVMDEISQGGGGGSSTLAGLNDVNISSPTDGQALVYDNATHKWVNRAGGGGSSTFAGLNDVNVQGVSNGDIARYNSATGKWTDSSDLTDLELTVSQMSASTLPYDANINTKQKIDNVESSIPTSASDLPYSSSKSTKQKIDDVENQSKFHIGDTMTFGGGNFMLAGRTGWSGKNFYFGIPLPKVLGNDVTGATISIPSGGSLYGISYNQAVAFHTLSKTDNVIGVVAGQTSITWEMVFQTAPLSITDGIVNLMVNTSVTITFT
jgi:hypothetical protein